MTLIKTFPSWDPDAVRAAAPIAATATPVSSDAGILDSTDRLHMTVGKTGKIEEGHIETFQELPDSFFRELADKKAYQNSLFAPEQIQVASVPGALVDQWIREGFDILSDKNITAVDIVNRLRATDMSKFITCDKLG